VTRTVGWVAIDGESECEHVTIGHIAIILLSLVNSMVSRLAFARLAPALHRASTSAARCRLTPVRCYATAESDHSVSRLLFFAFLVHFAPPDDRS